ncbi:hypothetical protein O3W44_22790 [Pantoea sp. LMR881]|uniref:hypothetical protein n=1 Tax=Pantoea sp. LMR881 TaxID=3014336 RepID=UPI0022AED861|nr:hypothetical protein [Pantoea sp. LMR881]MCZ4061362.1 hypothetical protein [Pantoea sp. LMR881]
MFTLESDIPVNAIEIAADGHLKRGAKSVAASQIDITKRYQYLRREPIRTTFTILRETRLLTVKAGKSPPCRWLVVPLQVR